MIGKKEEALLKAFTGMAGGVVAAGSTCGIVSGGTMGLALSHYEEIMEKGLPAQVGLFARIAEYTDWFKEKYGTSLCRESSGVDFHTIMGVLRYMLPGDKLMKCCWHIRGAIRYLYDFKEEALVATQSDHQEQYEPAHCAQPVLKGIKENTGVGDDVLENISFIFDGGIGLQGGACGALAGAVMGVNLLVGHNISDSSYFTNLKTAILDSMVLVRDDPPKKLDSANFGKEIIKNFKREAGGLECRAITGKTFSNWSDFQEYLSSSYRCKGLIELSTRQASSLIESYKSQSQVQ